MSPATTPQTITERLNALDKEAAAILAAPELHTNSERGWARDHATARKMVEAFTRHLEPCQ